MEHGLINYAETKVFLLADESVFYSRWGGGGGGGGARSAQDTEIAAQSL
jgi:hypothetical protein